MSRICGWICLNFAKASPILHWHSLNIFYPIKQKIYLHHHHSIEELTLIATTIVRWGKNSIRYSKNWKQRRNKFKEGPVWKSWSQAKCQAKKASNKSTKIVRLSNPCFLVSVEWRRVGWRVTQQLWRNLNIWNQSKIIHIPSNRINIT